MNKFDCDFLNRKTDKDLKTLFATWKNDLDSITSQLDIINTRMTNCKTDVSDGLTLVEAINYYKHLLDEFLHNMPSTKNVIKMFNEIADISTGTLVPRTLITEEKELNSTALGDYISLARQTIKFDQEIRITLHILTQGGFRYEYKLFQAPSKALVNQLLRRVIKNIVYMV